MPGGEPVGDRGADASAGAGDEHVPHYSSFPFVSGIVRYTATPTTAAAAT